MNYIFLGPPGSGKGTQAKKLAERLNLFYFGTGDLMREEAEKETEFGKIFKTVWDKGKGELVDEEIVEKFVESKIREKAKSNADSNANIVFDGFPRTIKQSQLLEKFIPISSKIFKVVNINVNPENLIERMETRRVCEACDKIFFRPEESGIRNCNVCGGKLIRRQEDDPNVIRERLKVYEKTTVPLISYYKEKGILIDIDGEPPIEEVTEEINKVVG